MHRNQLLRGASACALAFSLVASASAQETLPTIDVGSAAPGPSTQAGPAPAPVRQANTPPGFSPEKMELPIYREPTGQTFTSIDTQIFRDTPLVTIRDMLEYSPGVSFKQGNGPRDVVISIRGSSARNGFGVRNIVMLEDGFSVTQPDGLSRTDLTDPHAYAAVDVYRGPSSALFGNYANGGAINFRTRTGAEINGVEYGSEFGILRLHQQLHRHRQEIRQFRHCRVLQATCAATASRSIIDYNTQTVNIDGALAGHAKRSLDLQGHS